jgi:TP901 family phage tail tape measure protein
MAYNVTAQLNLQLNPQSINQITQALNSITNGKSIGGNLFNVNQIRNVTNELNNSKNAMMQFGEQSGLAAKRFGAFTLVAGSLVQITQGFRSMLNEAIAFDREMVKLKQVSNETAGSGVAAIRQEIDKLSTGLGVSSSQLARVSVILKQANLNLGETKTALEALALSALAPNFDSMEKTAEGAIAVLKQFKIPVEELKSSLGSINAVAGEFAVEASDLIGVIQRTGGAFKAAGGNLNELLALFTSVRQTTRESAESIATGLRTIFTRIQRTGTADALREVGVNLRYTRDEALALGDVNLTSQFVGAYEAIRRLSSALSQIPSTSPKFAQLVEELGGYRQISKVIPLIQEFSISQNALNVAITGGSSLMNSAAAAQGSFGNRLDKLKESYLQFGRALLDSSSFKTLFTMFETGAKSALMLLEALKPLIPMLTVFATMKIAQGIGSFGAGFVKGVAPVKKNSGGLLHFKKGGIVPGNGHGDIVPAMLEPGEMVIPKRMVKKYSFGGPHTADIDEEALNNPSGFRSFMKGSTTINPKTGKYRKFFHGTKGQDFDYFSNAHARNTWFGRGHYFSADAKVASRYSETDATAGGYDPGARVMSTTLQMKNPYTWNSDKSLKDFMTKGGKKIKSINGQFDQKDWDEIVKKGVLPEDISQGTLDHLNKIFTKFPSIAKKWNQPYSEKIDKDGKKIIKGMSPESKMKFVAHGATETLKKQGYDSVNVDYGLGKDYFNASTVFHPKQIKSLGNEGGWDPSLKEIGKNLGGYIERKRFMAGSPGGVKKYYGNKNLNRTQNIKDHEVNFGDTYRSERVKNIIGSNPVRLQANVKAKFFRPKDDKENLIFENFKGSDKKSADAFEKFVESKVEGERSKSGIYPVDIIKAKPNNMVYEVKNTQDIVPEQEIFDKYVRYKLDTQQNFENKLIQASKNPNSILKLGKVGIAYNGKKISNQYDHEKTYETQKKASGGFIVPGVGDTDSVPMNLPVGSYVIKKSSTKKMGFANGGVVPAILTPGELVIDPKTASSIGRAKLDHMNRTGRSAFAKGGRVGFAWGGGTGTGSSGNPINDLLSFSAFDQMDSGMRLAAENLAKLALRTGLASDVQESYNVAIKQLKDVTDKVIKEREQLAHLESMGAQGTAAYTQQKLKLAQAEQQANNILNRANQARVQDQPDQLAKIRSKKELQDAGISPTSQDSIDMAVTSTVIARKRGEIEKEYMESVMLQIKAAHPNLQADEQLALAKKMYEEALVKGTMAVNSQTGAIEGDTRYKAKGFDAANLLQQEQNANKPKKESLLRRGISAVKDQWQNNPEMKAMVLGAGASYASAGLESMAGDAKSAVESGNLTSYKNAKAASGGLQGAAMGLQMGSAFGPYGMAAGAAIGGIGGYLNSSFSAANELKNARAEKSQSSIEQTTNELLKNPSQKVDIAALSTSVSKNASLARDAASSADLYDLLGFGRSQEQLKSAGNKAEEEAKQRTAGQTSGIVASELSKKLAPSMKGPSSDAKLYELTNAVIATEDGFENLIDASRQVGESFAKARERIVKDAANMAKADAAKKAGLELERTIGKSNTFLKTFADNLEAASVRVQKSFSEFDSIMASLDSGSRQMQNYELEKNIKVLSNPSGYSSKEYSSSIQSTFSQFSPEFTKDLSNQYSPLAEIGNKLPQILSEAVNENNPVEAVQTKLLQVIPGGQEDPAFKSIMNSITAKMGTKDSLKDISGDYSKLSEELLKPLSEPMATHGAKIGQLMLDNSNKLSAGFAKLNAATLKLVDGIEKSDSLRLDQMQTMASAQSIASGQSLTGELGPNPQLQLNLAALQQSRVLGMAGRPDLLGNTAGIGQALKEAQDRQLEIEKTPEKQFGSQLDKAKSFSNAGLQVDLFRKALQDSIPKMQQVAGEYTKQANEMQKQRMAGASLAKKLALGGREARQEYKSGEKVFNKLISGQITQEQVMKSPRLAKQLESFQQMHQGVDYRGMNVEDTINKMVYSGAAEQRGFGPTAKQEAAVRMQAAQAQGMAADAQDQLNLSAARGITTGEQALVKSQDALKIEIEKLNLQMQISQEKLAAPSAEKEKDFKNKQELIATTEKYKMTKEEAEASKTSAADIKTYKFQKGLYDKNMDAQNKVEQALLKDPANKFIEKDLMGAVDKNYSATDFDSIKKKERIAKATGLDEGYVHDILSAASVGYDKQGRAGGKPISFQKELEIQMARQAQAMENTSNRMGKDATSAANKQIASNDSEKKLEALGGYDKVKAETEKYKAEEEARKNSIAKKEERLKTIDNPTEELMGPPAPPNGKQIAAVKVSAADTQPVAIAQNPAASGVAAPTKPSASEKLKNLDYALSSNATAPIQPMTVEERSAFTANLQQASAIAQTSEASSRPSTAQNELMGPMDLMGPHEAPNNQNLQNKLIDIGPPLPSVITEPYDAETTSSSVTTNTPTKMETWKKSGADPRYKPLPQSMISGGDPRFKRLPQSMTSGGDPRFRRVPQFFMPGKNQWKGPGADTTGIMGPPAPPSINQNSAIMGPPAPPSIGQNNVMSNNGAAPQNNQSNTNLNQSTSFNQTAASFTGFTASFDNSIANFNSAIENFGVKVGEFAAAVSVIPSSLTVNGEIGASVTTNAAGIVTQISEAVNAMIARQVIKSLPTPSMDEASKPS